LKSTHRFFEAKTQSDLGGGDLPSRRVVGRRLQKNLWESAIPVAQKWLTNRPVFRFYRFLDLIFP
jgi:hypothetical protein